MASPPDDHPTPTADTPPAAPPADTLTQDGPPAPVNLGLPAVPGYEITGVLGRGGMGVVYRAVQARLKREVALKVVLGGEFAGPTAGSRFRAEVEAVGALHHPNVVQVYDAGEHAGQPFLAMELAPGGTLKDRLADGPLPAADAAALVEALARGVQAAHEAGIVHRDVKPANVLFTADGTPKLSDFGLAKRADDPGLTATGVVLGSPSYMAPEQAAGHRAVGPPADVYGLGAVLYHVLTGRPPFAAGTNVETIDLVRYGRLASPRRLRPDVPAGLEQICLRCLSRSPADRYPSAAALADDLARFRAGTFRPPRRWARWAAAAGLVVTGITAAVLGFHEPGTEVPPPPPKPPVVPEDRPPGRVVALLVAVDQLKHVSSRQASASVDQRLLARVLARGAAECHIRSLTQSGRKPEDEDYPTAANIRARLKDLAAACRPEDTLIVALSGHGYLGTGAPGYGYWPADVRLTPTDPPAAGPVIEEGELAEALAACPAQVKLLLVDTGRTVPVRDQFDVVVRQGLRDVNWGRLRDCSVYYGCSLFQDMCEGPAFDLSGVGTSGAFLGAVVAGLGGEADADGDRVVTLGELEEFTARRVDANMTELDRHTARLLPKTPAPPAAPKAEPLPNRQFVHRVALGGARQTPELKGSLPPTTPILVLKPARR